MLVLPANSHQSRPSFVPSLGFLLPIWGPTSLPRLNHQTRGDNMREPSNMGNVCQKNHQSIKQIATYRDNTHNYVTIKQVGCDIRKKSLFAEFPCGIQWEEKVWVLPNIVPGSWYKISGQVECTIQQLTQERCRLGVVTLLLGDPPSPPFRYYVQVYIIL